MENGFGEVLTTKGRYDKNEEKKRKEKETREAKKTNQGSGNVFINFHKGGHF